MEETVAVQSEISMSIVTEQWRMVQARERPIFRWPWHRNTSSSPPPYPYSLLEQQERKRFDLRKHINPEPVIFLSCTAFGLLTTIYPLFLFWARCIEMFDTFDRTVDDNNSTDAAEFCRRIATLKDHRALDMVEEDVAEKSIYLQICSTLPAFVTAPIFGAWSDYHGRRSPFLLCQFGSFFYCALICAASHFYVGTSVYAFLAIAELCFGLFCGIMVFTMASTIVVDECRQKLAVCRSGIPPRIAIACAIQFLGFFLGNILASSLLSLFPADHVSQAYSLAFLVSTAFSALAILYTHFWVRETHLPEAQHTALPFATHLRHYTLDAFGVLTKRREGWIRLCLFLTVSFMFIEFMSIDNSLMFLVLKQFDWTDTEFSNLLLFRVLLNSIGTILLPLLLRHLPWPGAESLLVMVAIIASGISSALFAFAHTPPHIYALSLFSLLSAGISPGFRTILARFVSKPETGRLFALVTLVFIFCPLFSKGVLNNFFWATISTWPGMVFLLVATFHLFILLGQILVHCLMLPIWRKPSEDDTNSAAIQQSDEGEGGTFSGDSDRSMIGSTTAEE